MTDKYIPITPMRTEPYSMQEAYDIIVKHLARMTERAGFTNKDNTFVCRYLYKGKKCAIGILIPDKYCSAIENATISNILMVNNDRKERGEEFNKVRLLFSEMPVSFLRYMQEIHDLEVNWLNGKSDMFLELRRIGTIYKLKLNSLTAHWNAQ